MGILSGALTARRFRVLGDVPEGFRDAYRERLGEFAFRDPPHEPGKQEIEGWVQAHNLLDASFRDLNRWLYEPYALFALRIDKKVLPANILKATLDKECLAWCAERGVERCPNAVRAEIKERLEDQWLRRTLPRVRVTELCWHTTEGWLVLHSLSESVAERVRKRFHQTFGLRLVPWSPLDWLADRQDVERLVATVPVSLREDA
jgi:DNA recombination-dependent growth factor C